MTIYFETKNEARRPKDGVQLEKWRSVGIVTTFFLWTISLLMAYGSSHGANPTAHHFLRTQFRFKKHIRIIFRLPDTAVCSLRFV